MLNELIVIGANGVINNLGNIDHITNFIRLQTVGGTISSAFLWWIVLTWLYQQISID